jgi:hypothetical protein
MIALVALATGKYAYAADSYDPAQQPAPIVRANPGQGSNAPINPQMPRAITSSHPIPGVVVRSTEPAQTVSADAKGTEVRIVHGIANVSVHHPGKNIRILVDLPGGQTALLKEGLYTFNADSNIVRVLKGEADAYPGAAVDGIRVKEDHQFTFGVTVSAAAKNNRAFESSREELMADYLPPNNGDGPPRPGYGYGPGDGFYAYPPYGYYGYPYGFYGYPYGFGLGFGYYGGFGGFRGGGFRGRFR